MDIRDYLVRCAYKHNGDYNKICKAIINKEKVGNYNIVDKYITFFDEKYPIEFKKLRYPPWVIFYKGDINLINKKCISIVGSRNACNYGIKVTKEIVKANKDKVIVSGLAKGIDRWHMLKQLSIQKQLV